MPVASFFESNVYGSYFPLHLVVNRLEEASTFALIANQEVAAMFVRVAGRHSALPLLTGTIFLTLGVGTVLVGVGCSAPLLEVKHQKGPLPAAPDASACSKDDDACKLPGVPFYAVAYRCSHSTSWLRPVYLVTVTVTKADDGSTVDSAGKVFDLVTFNAKAVQTAMTHVRTAGTVSDYKTTLKELTDIPDSDLGAFRQENLPNKPEADNSVLAANQVVAERYVSTEAIYFYNVSRPWNGSANAEIDLSNEGILNKASGQAEDKTLDTILSTLGTLGAAALGIPAAAAGVAPVATATAEAAKVAGAAAVQYKFSVQIDTKIYKYTHMAPEFDPAGGKKYVQPPCDPNPTLVGANKEPFNSTFEDVTPGASPPPADDKSKPKKSNK